MTNKKQNLPKQLRLGKTRGSTKALAPSSAGRAGKININFQEINWTRRKLIITVALLSIPYLIAVIISFAVGNNLIGFVFLGIGALVVGMYLLLRYIERADF